MVERMGQKEVENRVWEKLDNLTDAVLSEVCKEMEMKYPEMTDEQTSKLDSLVNEMASLFTDIIEQNYIQQAREGISEKSARDQVIEAAEQEALEMGYDQCVIACDDGNYSFCRMADGRPTVPLFDDEKMIGIVRLHWENGLKASYEDVPSVSSLDFKIQSAVGKCEDVNNVNYTQTNKGKCGF